MPKPKPQSKLKPVPSISDHQLNRSAWPLLAVLAGVLLSAVVITFIISDRLGDNRTEQPTNINIEELSDYPTAYKEAKLPQYPSGQITHFGQSHDQPQDTIVIYVNTADSNQAVADYFDAGLKSLGWQLQITESAATEGVITRTYNRNNQDFSLAITRDGETSLTNVIITWAER